MRPAVIWLLLAFAAAVLADAGDEPWVEEEDLEEPYDEGEYEETHDRRRREVYVEGPYEEHVRVKRRCDEEPEYRVRRSTEYRRTPRQVHQYEVHEFTDEGSAPSSPPYEEMLAASAEHYHKVYTEPGAPAPVRYLNPDVSGKALPIPLVVYRPVTSHGPVQFLAPTSDAESAPVDVAPLNVAPVPLSVSNPAAIAQAPVYGPVPVASVPLSQPLKQLDGGDLFGAGSGHHHHRSHGQSQGGGYEKHDHHHGDHGGKSSKGHKSHHHSDKGGKGYKTDEYHRKEYEDAAGKKKKHHDNADHKGSHEEEAYGSRGAHFGEKKGHKKGHKTKGYHNKYHKDEFHKEHKFYDDYHKGGEHHRFGKFNAKHASNESGRKKAHTVKAGHDVMERGKKGFSNKGHVDADHQGYNSKHGNEEHHEHHSDHGKKGGKEGGSHWGYAKKN